MTTYRSIAEIGITIQVDFNPTRRSQINGLLIASGTHNVYFFR